MFKHFVVTGCPKSGTGWISRVYQSVQIPCGHEKIYTIFGINPWGNDIKGDSSWMAAGYLDQIDFNDVAVFHQVRHPLKMVATFADSGQWHPLGDYEKWQMERCSLMKKYIDPVDIAAACWIDWNGLIMKYPVAKRYRVRDVTSLLLRECMELVGLADRIPVDFIPLVERENVRLSHERVLQRMNPQLLARMVYLTKELGYSENEFFEGIS